MISPDESSNVTFSINQVSFSNRYLGGILLEGGSETTASFLQSLILYVTAFPDTQRKAQKEIDSVVGQDRLPLLSDMPALPYVEAVMKETLRWNAILHLGNYAHITFLYCLMLLCFRVAAYYSRR